MNPESIAVKNSALLTLFKTCITALLLLSWSPICHSLYIRDVTLKESSSGKVRITTNIQFTCTINWTEFNTTQFSAVNLMYGTVSTACVSYRISDKQLTFAGICTVERATVTEKVPNREYLFEIKDAKLTDQQIFSCWGFEGFGSIEESDKVPIEVQVPPSEPVISLSDQGNLVVGEPLTVICEADTGKPKGSLIWYETLVDEKTGNPVRETPINPDTSIDTPRTNGTVSIRQTKSINALLRSHNKAKYRCAANNPAVNQNQNEANPSTELTLNVLYGVPEVPVLSHSGEVIEGVTVIDAGSDIACTAKGNPEPTLSWNKILGPGDLTSAKGTLTIPRDAKLGKYQYRCSAQNSPEGKLSQEFVDINFDVKVPPTTPAPTKPEPEPSTEAPTGGDPGQKTDPAKVDTAGIIGGVVGAIAAIILIIIIVFCVCRNKKKGMLDEDTEKGHKGQGLDNGPIGGFDVEMDDGRPYSDPYGKQQNGGAFPVDMVDNTPGSRKAFHVPADPNGFEPAYM